MAQTLLSVLGPQFEGTVTLSYSQWEETVFQSVGFGLNLNLFSERKGGMGDILDGCDPLLAFLGFLWSQLV